MQFQGVIEILLISRGNWRNLQFQRGNWLFTRLLLYDFPLTKINKDVEMFRGDAIRVIKSCGEE